ncbi:MAG TPA: tetratricopeptide repeat protein, partial [Planctomycetota bacterium]|nr:tetratricopeptide repeat protein [Planctomycetota bacterium]
MFEAVRAERAAGKPGEARDRVATRLREEEPLPGIAEVLLCKEAAVACAMLSSAADESSYYQRAARVASSLGWTQEHARCLGKATRASTRIGALPVARALAAQALPLLQTMVEVLDLPTDLSDLGVVQIVLEQSQAALVTFERALARLQQIPDVSLKVNALQMIATIHWQRGDLQLCQQATEQAYREATLAGERELVAETALHLATLHGRRGDHEHAMQLYSEALAVQRQLGMRRAAAFTIVMIAGVHSLRGEQQRAAELLQEALSEHRALGDRRETAHTLLDIGELYQGLGRAEKAVAMYEEALEVQRELGDARGLVRTYRKLGSLYTTLVRPYQALHCLQFSRDEADRLDDGQSVADAELGLGKLCSQMGRPREALAHLSRALAEYERLDRRLNAATALTLLAREHLAQDHLPLAIEFASRAAALHHEMKMPNLEGHDLVQLAVARIATREYDLALAAAQQSLTTGLASDEWSMPWIAHDIIGRVLVKRGDFEQALAHLEPAVRALIDGGQHDSAAQVRLNLACTYLLLERAEDALRESRGALDYYRSLATGLAEWEHRQEIRRGALAGLTAVAMLLDGGSDRRQALLADAFWLTESARSQLLLETLANRRAMRACPIPAALSAEAQR